jgi:hypothetical protein
MFVTCGSAGAAAGTRVVSVKPGAILTLAVLGAVLAFALMVLGIRDLGVLSSPAGRCMARVQPSILIGASPTLITVLDCA